MTTQDLVYGLHAVAALFQQRRPVQQLWVQDSRHDARLEELLTQAAQHGVPVQRVSRGQLDALTGHGRHQGAVARAGAARSGDEEELKALVTALQTPAFLLVLDGVQDPQNLGACLRSANAAGVQAVIAPTDRAADLTPVARKAAAGAAEMTPFFQVTNLARTLRWLKEQNIWLVGLAAEADQSLYELDLKGPLALVLGAEGGGLRRLSKEHCDFLARIPLPGTVESLNVSVAAGVALFEALRQRQIRK
ncbi:MAG: 23S rRNA (guanosine(2251)-2'-O)-methyltransferase RlmB [Gammaproteobacteria bacterium]|nr:23S rRNA (guanosine(2251)-2'-O)-methyltransferase RlmB [Gammaproteobacteria bacterium]